MAVCPDKTCEDIVFDFIHVWIPNACGLIIAILDETLAAV